MGEAPTISNATDPATSGGPSPGPFTIARTRTGPGFDRASTI